MMLCSRCKKRPAVVFISSVQGGEKKNEGLCLLCAKEMKIPQISDYMKSMGITDDELEQFSDQMTELMDGDSFEMGGNNVMPQFLQSMFKDGMDAMSGNFKETSDEPETGSKKKSKKERQRKDLKFLNNYCTNLSQKAEKGELDAVIGRDKEISRVVQILSRRTKNNPCLIGEPGVGKTAIAEGIAQHIANGNVPFNLRDKKIYLLDLTALVAGTQFRGQFESRVKGLVNEVKREGNIILFIDEVHNLVGAGDSEGSMNAANILKPALSRGEVQVIGATTFGEYRKFIEKDSALERRFQPVNVDEPTVDETIEVLLGIKQYYENYHKVKVSDSIVRLCARLSERYITDRFLPDKAIDLLDESCACTSIRNVEISQYDKLVKDTETMKQLEESMESEEEIDYEALAKVKADILRNQGEIEKLKPLVEDVQVTEDDIAKVIELWTGIPANKIKQSEFVKMQHLEENLKKHVVGQDNAIELLSRAIKRTRIRLSEKRRPASFIFVGPTGVGKTELVKQLAAELFDSTEPLIRFDMTEYMEKHSVSKMIGSPPGYVGYDDEGQLTEKVRRKPYSVILFDEIEKAHPDVMNILLQILDEGKIEDSKGRTINFENTIICMTSNAGSSDKSTGVGFNKTETDISREKALKGLREFLRPEFLGRIDEIVVFNSLTEENFASIAKIMVDEIAAVLKQRGIKLTYSEDVLKCIAKQAYGKASGARDIRRVIREQLEDGISNVIIESMDSVSEMEAYCEDEKVKVK